MICIQFFFAKVHCLPTWRRQDKPGRGQRNLSPECGGCWGSQSPKPAHEEPTAVSTHTHIHTRTHTHYFLLLNKWTVHRFKVIWGWEVTYFAFRRGACHLSRCYGDFIRMDSQTIEHKQRNRETANTLNIWRSIWTMMKNHRDLKAYQREVFCVVWNYELLIYQIKSNVFI